MGDVVRVLASVPSEPIAPVSRTGGVRVAPRDWYRVARVRSGGSGPSLERNPGELLFAPELQPHVLHPAIVRLGGAAQEELLRRALVRYLHATSVLEVRIVHDVAAELAHGAPPWDVPARARLGALQLSCDEAFHAVLASDLLDQLGCDERDEPAPAFERRLHALIARHAGAGAPCGAERILRLLFVVVSETAISASLAGLARNRALVSGVRGFVAEHARDEARHGAFFSELFATFWAQQSALERARLAPLLPALVHAFLAPDLAGIRADLGHVGLSGDAVERVVAEAYEADAVARSIAAAARPVIACFRRGGALVPSDVTPVRSVSFADLEER